MILNDVTDETRSICERLVLQERDYVTLLKHKQKERIREEYEVMMRDNFKINGTEEGRFLYVSDLNTTGIIKEVTNQLADENKGDNSEEIVDESHVDILKL